MIYIIPLVLLVFVFIYFIWKIETSLPPFPQVKTGYLTNYDEIKDWFYLLGQKKKFNGIVSIKQGNISLLECYVGYKDVGYNHRIDRKTKFRLASLSKQFTAIGILVLVKKFPEIKSIDTLISDIIPEFTYPNVSIRHLLNQTSGIDVDYINLAKKNRKIKNKILTNQNVLELICTNKVHSQIPPSTKFIYNNTNYVLLAALIERVAKVSFEDFMKSEVFVPLGLDDTTVWNLSSTTALKDIDNVAMDFEQYLGSKPRLIEPTWIDGVAGDGGIFSSLEDLQKWMNILDSNNLLSKDEMQEVFQQPLLVNGNESEYGFGWVIDNNYMWHDGKWLATNSCIIKDRDKDITLIMIDNASNLRFDKIFFLVKEQIFKTI